VDLGVKVTGPIADGIFITSLVNAIHSQLDTSLSAESDSKYTVVNIAVGVKPVAGLPAVRLEPAAPPQKPQ
jgi:hypothetical protein